VAKDSSQLLNLLTFGLWSKVGRLTHYAFDAVLCKLNLASLCMFYRLISPSLGFPCWHEAINRFDVSYTIRAYPNYP